MYFIFAEVWLPLCTIVHLYTFSCDVIPFHGSFNTCYMTSLLKDPLFTLALQNGVHKKKPRRPFVESFEKIPLLTAATTFIGFYLMLLMGYISSIVFTPKVARENNRKVRASLQIRLSMN